MPREGFEYYLQELDVLILQKISELIAFIFNRKQTIVIAFCDVKSVLFFSLYSDRPASSTDNMGDIRDVLVIAARCSKAATSVRKGHWASKRNE